MPRSLDGLYDELVRVRGQGDELAGRVTRLELQSGGMKQTLDRVEEKVSALATADEIARAVTKHDRERGRLRLTRHQKVTVLGAIGIILANLILRLAGVEGL